MSEKFAKITIGGEEYNDCFDNTIHNFIYMVVFKLYNLNLYYRERSILFRSSRNGSWKINSIMIWMKYLFGFGFSSFLYYLRILFFIEIMKKKMISFFIYLKNLRLNIRRCVLINIKYRVKYSEKKFNKFRTKYK